MCLQTIRTLVDELQMRYGKATDTNVRTDFPEKSSMFDISVMALGSYLILGISLRITACRYGSHKYIMDVMDALTYGKYDP